jgi:FG-GAP-like repeat
MKNRRGVTPAFLIAALTAVVLGGSAAAQAPSYFTPASFSYSPPLVTVLTWTPPVSGDFDNDGIPDVATTVSGGFGVIPSGTHVAVFRGTAAATLAGPLLSPSIYQMYFGARMRALDADADGNLDVLVRLSGNGTALSLHSGVGNGTFAIPSMIVLPSSGQFEVGDLNGDQFPDLVSVSTAAPTNVGVYTGNGAVFALSQSLPVPGFYQGDVNLADVDGDAIQDIIIGNGSTISVAQGLGSALFAPFQSFAASSTIQPFGPLLVQAGTFAIGDLNQDGCDDLAFFGATGGTTNVRLMLGSPSTLLQPSTPIASTPIGSELLIFDVDGDGKKDLVWQVLTPPPVATSTASVRVALGTGTGAFSIPGSLTYATVGYYPGLAPLDLEGDGDLDLATVAVQGFFTDNGGITATQVGVIPNRAVAGAGAPGSYGVPTIGAGSAVVGNAAFSISVANAAPIQLMALGLGSSPVPGWNGAGVGVDIGTLLAFPGAPLGIAITTSNAGGVGSVGIPIPNVPALQGFEAYAQWLVLDPLGTFSVVGSPCSLSRRRTLIVQ